MLEAVYWCDLLDRKDRSLCVNAALTDSIPVSEGGDFLQAHLVELLFALLDRLILAARDAHDESAL